MTKGKIDVKEKEETSMEYLVKNIVNKNAKIANIVNNKMVNISWGGAL